MNLFLTKTNNQYVLIGASVSLTETKNIFNKKINGHLVFYDENNHVLGFNLILKECKYPLGRLFINDDMIKFIYQEIKIEITKQNYFKVGLVVDCKKIPNTHLSLTKINLSNNKQLEIVCGAKNVRKGLKVVVATVGAVMYDGTSIISSNLRGNKSNGMLCSKKELNITKGFNDEGIIELDNYFKIGQDFEAIYCNININ